MKRFSVIVALVFFALGVVFLILQSQKAEVLTPSATEEKILNLVRDVYGDNITDERLVRVDGDLVLHAQLQNENVRELQINLSNLARKHDEEGVSLPVLRLGMRFD